MPRVFSCPKTGTAAHTVGSEAPNQRGATVLPVDQTIFAASDRTDGNAADGTPGNCWQACIASLLELPLAAAPHFILKESWWEDTKEFVGLHMPGWTMEHYPAFFPVYLEPDNPANPTHVIGSGPSPRGDFLHAVIVDAVTGEIAHDPHPSRAGLVKLETMFVLTPKPIVEYVEASR